jgi:hypothetical protein
MKGHEVIAGTGNCRRDQGSLWIIEHDRTRRITTNREPISTIPYFAKLTEFQLSHLFIFGA